MDEKLQVLFMQTRLLRLASERWEKTIEDVVHVFTSSEVFAYIEDGFGIFHCEGDLAILEDIEEFLERKGVIYR